jgi:hypothetical protein
VIGMDFVALFLWGWLLGAFLLGLAMGWISVVLRRAGMSRATFQQAVILTAALAVLAIIQAIPGRAGYWLDLGLVLLVAYIVGCVIGSLLRSWVVARDMASD